MRFQSWLTIYESTTIADSLKSVERDLLQRYKVAVRSRLQNLVPAKSVETATNFFAYLYITERIPPDAIPAQLNQDWQQYGAYVTDRIGSQKNQFMMVFNRQDLDTANAIYHRDLKLSDRNRRKGPEGLTVVEVDKALEAAEAAEMPSVAANYRPSVWAGWKWVSVGCGHSNLEGAAAGHCGNSGSKRGDNIVSLRDPGNKVHLTFIINTHTGNLGEAKGVNNEKPDRSYHPAIVSLLLSGYVKHYKGGGYKPENNFHPDDLPEPIKNYVLDHLEGVDHKVPENYHPLAWVSQWTQAAVDSMPMKGKIQLLESTLKVVKNHGPFDTYEYDDNGEKTELEANVPKLHFDLQKLALEVTPHIKNIKQLTGILSDLYSIQGKNIIWSNDDVKKYRPDLVGADGEVTVGGGDAMMDDSWHISNETLDRIAKMAVAGVEGKSLRDKVELAEELSEIGHREEDVPNGVGLDKWREWNIYDDQIQKLDIEVLKEIVSKGIVPKSLNYEVQNSIARRTKKHPDGMYGHAITTDGRKTYHKFYANSITSNWRSAFPDNQGRYWHREEKVSDKTKNDPFYRLGKEARAEIEQILPEIKPYLIKRGYSEFIGKKRIAKAIGNVLIDILVEQTGRRLKQRFKGQAGIKSKKGEEFSITFFRPVTEHIQAILSTGQDDQLFECVRAIDEEFTKAYQATIKRLPQIIKEHSERIIQEANTPKVWKNQQYSPEPRDVQRRHHARQFESFQEWLSRK